jgi:hypothetical protein
MFSGTAEVYYQVCQFFVSSVCPLVRVTIVDKNKAVICCLLATSVIMLSENKKKKRKIWSKKCYLKRNISCDVHLLNELLETECFETMPLWCRQVNCGIPWIICAVLCVEDDWKGHFRGLRYCLSKLRSLLSFFPSGMMSHSKIAQFNWECIGRLRSRYTIADLLALGVSIPPGA